MPESQYASFLEKTIKTLRKFVKIRYIWLVPVVLVITFIAIRSISDDELEGVRVLDTTHVAFGDVKKEILATGVIRPEEGAVIKLGTRFTGVISELHVKLGDSVTKGQIIAELDEREQEFICQKNRAKVQKLKAQLLKEQMKYPLQIKEAIANLQRAKEEKQHAEKVYNRYKLLAQRGAAATKTLEDATRAYRMLVQSVVARNSIKERLEAEFQHEISYIQHAILEAEAELNQSETQLSYAHLVSPMQGVVSDITARQGETVVAGFQVANLITILDTKRLELQILIDENDIGSIKNNAEVRYMVESFPDKEFVGKVALIHPAPELRDNIVYYRALVRVSLDDTNLLRPEMTARCYVAVAEKKNVLSVPNAAFKWIGDVYVIFVLDEEGVYPVQVKTGLAGLFTTEIMDGLQEGQQIVTHLELPDVLPASWKDMLQEKDVGVK